ncbi:hypothetical protein AN644_02305 [Candidatus Epulonipiscium fishelsonii]|nr:hypothetical protein AN644_02305 [Epulopiscium sp. SCG-C06WGA-EpuloA1]
MHLISTQLKQLGRDSLLLFLVIYPFILTIIGRILVPIITDATLTDTFNLANHYPAIMVFFVIMNPIIFGAIVGLMLLDERENNVISAIQILPIKFSQYLLSKATLFTVLSIASGIIVTYSIDLYYVPFIASLFINIVASLGVFFGMLLVNLFASNKVEGFATMKGSGFLLVIPVVALYIPAPFKYLCALAPAYWPSMALASYSGNISVNVWLFLVTGTIYILVLSYFMYKIILKKLLS